MRQVYFSAFILLILNSCTTFNILPSKKIHSIEFSNENINNNYEFIYQTISNSPELIELNSIYKLDKVALAGDSEYKRILSLLDWTHQRWDHDGNNQPSSSNTLTILKEAEEGKSFRCVEYGIVLNSALAANGFYSRTVGLKTRDVEKVKIGAGHVLTEVWSDKFNKWILVDAQFNIMPVFEGKPLNAVELQEAIINKKDFKLVDINGEISNERRKAYLKFIPPYLYYFDFRFDQRSVSYKDIHKVNGKTNLMLVPLSASNPKVFQRKFEMNYFEYTHSLLDFYHDPIK